MRKWQLGILMVTLAILGGFVLFTRPGKPYKNSIVDAEEYNDILASKTYDNELLAEITFDGQKLFYDERNGFYLYSLTQGDPGAYNPDVSAKDHEGKKLKVAFLKDSITEDMIRENKGISFAVYDKISYYSAEIRCTTLPIVAINSYDNIPDYKEMEVGMDITVYDNGRKVVNRVTSAQGTVHVRGATSLANPKKNLKLSLSKVTKDGQVKSDDRSILGLRRDDDWILNALYSDPEKVREVFSAGLWKKSVGSDNSYGLDTGVEYRYVEVFLNGNYNGLYALGYPLEISQLGIKDTDRDKALFRKRMPVEETAYLGEDGGVISYSLQSNQDGSVYGLLRDYMMQFDDRCDDAEALSHVVDADNLVDYFLYVNLIQGWDSITKNQNLRLQRDSKGIKALYIPWDMDFTWGVGTDRQAYSISPDQNYEYKLYDPVYRSFQLDESYTRLMKQKYRELRKSKWSDDNILAMLSGYEKDIYDSGAFLREQDIWDCATNSADERLSVFKEYVLSRLKAMDTYVDEFEAHEDVDHVPLKFGFDSILTCAGIPYEEDGQIFLLHVNNKELWNEDFYGKTMEEYGIPEDYISENVSLRKMLGERSGDAVFMNVSGETDLVVIMDDKEVITGENFFQSGSILDTNRGMLIYFEGEDGSSGLYLDDNELFTENANDRTYDIRLICIDAESLEITETYEYSF